jgi:hypothetical protein
MYVSTQAADEIIEINRSHFLTLSVYCRFSSEMGKNRTHMDSKIVKALARRDSQDRNI